ncbi:MAG: hypothetical protein C5B51_16265 [Terriglobia bacterium]|nr:MAG: hypothetical protein C5B51_16265 [Terriglobia bacterium]
MSSTTQVTWEQFLEMEECEQKQELLDGELITLPPARLNHADIALKIFRLLESVPHGKRVWHEVGYRLRRGWLIPDVSVSWPDQPVVDGYIQRAPMIAVEVVSPTNRPSYIDKKTAVYLEEGAAEVWVVYPENSSMTVLRKGNWERVTETYTCSLLNLSLDLRTIIPPQQS